MTGVGEITDALKRCLKSRGMTYAGLARALSLSEPSVKRLFASGGFSLRRLERICRVLEIDIYDLARLAHSARPAITELSVAQERALAANPRLLLIFHLLLGDWRIEDIVAEYEIARAECLKLALELERLRLIDVKPQDEIRLRTARQVAWRHDGPIRRTYQPVVLAEFFAIAFDRPGEALRFEAKELSSASREVMRRKLERLVKEFNELAEVDAALQPAEREAYGMVIGLRPYVLSIFSRYKRTRRRSR